MFRIVRADPAAIEVAFAVDVDLPSVAVVGLDDGRVVASGGLAWGGGRCWLFFGTLESKPEYAVPIFREAKRLIRRALQLGEPAVWTVRDTGKPSSEKLLKMLGFAFHGIEPDRHGQEVEIWRWQN